MWMWVVGCRRSTFHFVHQVGIFERLNYAEKKLKESSEAKTTNFKLSRTKNKKTAFQWFYWKAKRHCSHTSRIYALCIYNFQICFWFSFGGHLLVHWRYWMDNWWEKISEIAICGFNQLILKTAIDNCFNHIDNRLKVTLTLYMDLYLMQPPVF